MANHSSYPAQRFVVMGVSGCGKSEIGARLAVRLGVPHVEGDAFHPPANIAKMAAGEGLTDTDRHGWLLILQAQIRLAAAEGRGMVLSCSALKRRYRDLLSAGDPGLVFIHLFGDRDVIANRMQARSGHFMPVSLLDSQFRDLEAPGPDERAIELNVETAPEKMIEQVLQSAYLKQQQGQG